MVSIKRYSEPTPIIMPNTSAVEGIRFKWWPQEENGTRTAFLGPMLTFRLIHFPKLLNSILPRSQWPLWAHGKSLFRNDLWKYFALLLRPAQTLP